MHCLPRTLMRGSLISTISRDRLSTNETHEKEYFGDWYITIFNLNDMRNVTCADTETSVIATDLNYWIKHPFEFSDPILKPEYL